MNCRGEAILRAEWGWISLYNTTTEHPRDRGSRASVSVASLVWAICSRPCGAVQGAHIFRCNLSGSSSDRLLEVPAWMFDRSVSGGWRSLRAPHVDLAALHALAKLLDDADTSSQSGGMSAALISHEASRRDVHAKSTHDISVRSILEPAPRGDSRNAAMAETRQALTGLIVQLFVDHANCGRACQQKETGHDA